MEQTGHCYKAGKKQLGYKYQPVQELTGHGFRAGKQLNDYR
jgi:hypothetical protein